jgi:NDP-sugar pyrophosphorylase family protein
MLEHSVKTLNIPGNWFFVARQDHLDNFPEIEPLLNKFGSVIVLPGLTGGAAESLLAVKDYVNLDEPMISVNCDQYLDYDSSTFINLLKDNPDVSYIMTFNETDPKCSYAKTDVSGNVIEVREKQVISNEATVGVYHWSKSREFFIDCEQMIHDKVKDNNEYYVAPVYNYTIKRNLPVKTFKVSNTEFYPVGTPKDLEYFINNYEKSKT